jgi:hypothetical protein
MTSVEDDYTGRRVRLLVPIVTRGGDIYPAGYELRVIRDRLGRVTLFDETSRDERGVVRRQLRGVSRYNVVLVEESTSHRGSSR